MTDDENLTRRSVLLGGVAAAVAPIIPGGHTPSATVAFEMSEMPIFLAPTRILDHWASLLKMERAVTESDADLRMRLLQKIRGP